MITSSAIQLSNTVEYMIDFRIPATTAIPLKENDEMYDCFEATVLVQQRRSSIVLMHAIMQDFARKCTASPHQHTSLETTHDDRNDDDEKKYENNMASCRRSHETWIN